MIAPRACVTVTVNNGIAWLTLQRPEVLNVLDRPTVRELAVFATELRQRSDVRVVVTRGAGRAFCAGSDLRDIGDLAPAEASAAEREHADAGSLLADLPQLTLAVLHGYALGGGLGLALYHDFRIAAQSTTIGLPEVELGWTPPWALGRLVDVVGPTHARWLTLSGSRIDGSEAYRMGLVNDVISDDKLEDQVNLFARRLADLPPIAVRETKSLLNRMSPLRDPAWDLLAADAFERCFATPEARANVRAFLSRRKST